MPQGKESVHGRSPFLSTKNADFPQTIGTRVSSPKEKKSKPIPRKEENGTLTFIFLSKGFEKRGNSEDAENGRVYGDYRS